MKTRNRDQSALVTRLFLSLSVLLSCAWLELTVDSAEARHRSRSSSRKVKNLTPEAFSTFVLEVGAEEFPDLELAATDSPFTLKWKEDGHISLDNLYKHVRGMRSRSRLKTEVRNFLEAMKVFPPIDEELKTWEDARARIRPQIFPRDYLSQKEFAKKMVFKPLSFSGDLMEGYVVDSERAFRYVLKSDLKQWKVSLEKIKETAYENLVEATAKTRLTALRAGRASKQGKYLIISVNDGYAAARLLLPAVRNEIEAKLGKPCYVAIPNRDYLIAWSYDTDREKNSQFENKVIRNFHFKDHPLSKEIYAIVNSKIEKKAAIQKPEQEEEDKATEEESESRERERDSRRR